MSQARGAIKWAIYMIALLVVGPLASTPLASLRDPAGGHQATMLVGASIPAGIAASLAPLSAAGGLGLITARLIGARHGMVAAGLIIAWAAWRSASLDAIMRATRDASAMPWLSLEGAILGLVGLLIASLVWTLGHTRGPDARPLSTSADTPARRPHPLASLREGLAVGPVPVVAALLAAAVVAWLVAIEPLKGQTIAACLAAGIAAGGFARASLPRESPATPIPPMIAMAILAAAGPISALIINGSAAIPLAAVTGKLFNLAIPMPLDWLAGALWGIPIGLAWAESMTEKHDAPR